MAHKHMRENSAGPGLVVLGDFAWQYLLTPSREEKNRFVRHTGWIGAPLIQKMITNAINANPTNAKIPPNKGAAAKSPDPPETPLPQPPLSPANVKPDYGLLEVDRADVIKASAVFIADLDFYPKAASGSKKDQEKNQVLRLARDVRTETEGSADPAPNGPAAALPRFETLLEQCNDDAASRPRLAVIYDRGLALRKSLGPLKKFLSGLGNKDSVVLVIEDDLEDDKLNELLASIGEQTSTTVLITVDALRKYGLPIVEYGSIEQAVRDIGGHLDQPPLNFLSAKGRQLVVVFRESAALHLRRSVVDKVATVTGSTHYCPNWDRLAQGAPKRYGFMPGKLWIMLAAVARQIYADWENKGTLEDLGPALRLGIAAFNLYAKNGFNANKPLESLEQALGDAAITTLEENTRSEKEFLLSSLFFKGSQADIASHWRRIDSASCGFEPYDVVTLRKVVTDGVEAAFRRGEASAPNAERHNPWFPGYVVCCPYLEFGDIKTVDEREVASFLDLARIMNKYLDDAEWDKPLSIAVFGPPGSGKSFAVKQILKAISPVSAEREPLTFNLAQFSMVDQLTDAFHLVQDRALSGGGVPLVIFDEFDSDFGRAPLGWLKYFLAPMQDGLFRGQAQDYRVGRAIFLFSGGTASRFAEFQQKLQNDPERRKQVKINDFLSRLRGHLDLLSINGSKEDDEAEKRLAKIRRAMLLRSLLIQHAKPILKPAERPPERKASIQDAVIDLFLNQWDYRHGVRSMEAVIQTSRWIDGKFVLASLPAEMLLASHVVDASKTLMEFRPARRPLRGRRSGY